MKIQRFTLFTHILVWVALMVIPYISTDQVFNAVYPESENSYLILCLIFSSVLILTFYFNYWVLIPRLLLPRRYWMYFVFLGITVVATFLLSAAIFFYFGSIYIKTEDGRLVETMFPVIVVNALLLWLLAIVSSILWTIYSRLKQAEKEKLSAQVATLKAQINPHFLFNTLNNIYAMTIDSAPKAADMVDKLSEMMRYTMRDTQQDYVSLEDEVNYVNNYIELQKLRLDRSVKLEYVSPAVIPAMKIAPLLLIPFVENAFKHGVNSEQKSIIKIDLQINKTELQLLVVNNKVKVQNEIFEKSGLGINNTYHRLNLIYPSNHLLVINETDKEFSVSLHINLQ